MSTESFVNSFDSSTTTATPMASPLPDPNKPIHIPKYLELIYDENDVPPSPVETEVPVSQQQLQQQQTPYEIPINLNNQVKSSQIVENHHHSHSIPIESSNCSSISGDEGSMQALLGQAPPPPPPPTNDTTNTGS